MLITLKETKPDVQRTIQRLNAQYDSAYQHKGGHVTLRVLPPSDVTIYEHLDFTTFDFYLY